MGIVEELGSGIRKMFKYTPFYANGKEPIIEEQDVYRIEIPYVPTLLPTTDESGKKSTLKSTLKGTRKDIVEIILNSPHITIPQMAESIVGNISKFAWDVTVLRVGQLASEICFSSQNQSIGGSNGCAGELTNWDGTKKRRRADSLGATTSRSISVLARLSICRIWR